MNYLEINAVRKQYANHLALDDVSFNIPSGSVFGLVGPNGAGKTTLIRIINQITAPDSGHVLIQGEPLKSKHTAKIGYLPEERGLYKKMGVLDQIIYFGRLKDLSRSESTKRAKYWMDKFNIGDWKNKKIEELSKGMQQKIQFIITVLHEPELIILDEPFSGFDPVNTQLIREEIVALKKSGCTVIFSTHRMESVEEICNYLGMIHLSKKVLEGSVREVRERYKNNIIQVDYKGQLAALADKAKDIESLGHEVYRAHFVREELGNKALINQLNQEVDLLAFEEKLPSIEEIFIGIVEGGQNG